MTIAELGRKLRAREMSVRELTEDTFRRIQAAEPQLNAFITLTEQQALQRADHLDALFGRGEDLGPLHGIPVAHKDCVLTDGIRTTGGSKVFANFVPDHSAEIVHLLDGAGTVMVGKTGLHELTYGITNVNPHYGPVRNPYDKTRVSGGSSGGSGAAVAAGLVPIATGTDTGGSIRIPASFCGCVGLKPTYGRVSREGVMPLGPSQDHVGPMAGSVADCALLYSVLAKVPAPAMGGVDGLRIGIPENYFWEGLAPEVRFAVRGAVHVIAALGARPREVRLPDIQPLMDVARTTLLYEAASTLGAHSSRPEEFGADVWALIEQGHAISPAEYIQSQARRQQLALELSLIWADLDCLMMPATPMVAYPIETAENLRAETTRLTRPFNLLGWPAISVPCGFSPDGLPIGAQIAAAPGREDVLFQAAAAIEGALRLDLRASR